MACVQVVVSGFDKAPLWRDKVKIVIMDTQKTEA